MTSVKVESAVSPSTRTLIRELFDIGAVKLGSFKLKSGITSPVYIDLRLTVSHPKILEKIARELQQAAGNGGAKWDLLCGVPYTALPFATTMGILDEKPMVMRRKEAKSYGTKKIIEGDFAPDQTCLIVEDLVTSGLSVMETVEPLVDVGLKVSDVVVLLDREQGGRTNLESRGIRLHSVATMTQVLDTLVQDGCIEAKVANDVRDFIRDNQVLRPVKQQQPPPEPRRTYSERSATASNPISQKLFQIMEAKESNLSVAADVTTKDELLRIAEKVGPHICVLKTHADIIEDWDSDTGPRLREVADKYNFLIFEDRKFADIGNTVVSQFTGGVHRIAEWADIVNAHSVPGPGIVEGLARAIASSGRDIGLLLLAQMSSAGNLASALSGYTEATVKMAKENSSCVIGFICTEAVGPDEFVHMTPGVQLDSGKDALGQQYNTPESVVNAKKSDIIIVGRGIFKAADPAEAAAQYRKAGWEAYKRRCSPS